MWRSERLYGCAFIEPLNNAALAAAQLQGMPVGEAAVSGGAVAVPRTLAGDTLGMRINRLRREAGLTLADVAARLSVSKPTVWAWEKGKARPLPERMEAIAAALDAAPEDLVEPGAAEGNIGVLIEDCRARIAQACGTAPDAVRILIEL
jgi:transcriptional regulator with XRE-family HTH domain